MIMSRDQPAVAQHAERPTIVFCDGYSNIYGAQRSMLELYADWHRRQRYRLHFVYTQPGELCETVKALGIPVTRLQVGAMLGSFHKRLLNVRWWECPALGWELLAYGRALKRVLLREKAALLHCNNDRAGMMSFLGARWARCPMVSHVRRDRSYGRLDRVIHAGATEIIWVSKRVRDDFAHNHHLSSTKGRVIYNGRVLAERDAPSTHAEVRAEFGLPPDAWVALVLASFDPRKDHETLVRAAERACAEEPRLFFLVAGYDRTPEEGRRRKIEALARSAGLARRVLFLGHRGDVGRLLRGVDVLLNPAREEALGGALIEAIGHGVPCVATDTGGTSEIVPDGRCGYLVQREDHQALAARTLALLRDEETRRRFSVEARAHFDENFTLEQCSTRTAAFFDEVIARHRGPRRLGAGESRRETCA